ncbi:hypothetical protein Xmau_00409 [Xenorhabdus mauleonii]|uniref:Uncharacterized protein n=1 Tax=Xenorhabdus mauleonii TaxID=351675 RepID=A0A1I3IWI5_9GAMM|nr:hypothetical protein [Xenorhabdus mauleonii]PHM46016.1 hypothetical protein Xmau_00409 [Xenorhabdus mauleonii]SFI52238.1 hypothetical protein SAMN05421680_1025 [Xenorhabdus mauleonii]
MSIDGFVAESLFWIALFGYSLWYICIPSGLFFAYVALKLAKKIPLKIFSGLLVIFFLISPVLQYTL